MADLFAEMEDAGAVHMPFGFSPITPSWRERVYEPSDDYRTPLAYIIPIGYRGHDGVLQ